MTTRERQMKFIEDFGRGSLLIGLTEMLAYFGPDWLTDDQIKDIVQYKIAGWRSSSRNTIRNRKINQDRTAALQSPSTPTCITPISRKAVAK